MTHTAEIEQQLVIEFEKRNEEPPLNLANYTSEEKELLFLAMTLFSREVEQNETLRKLVAQTDAIQLQLQKLRGISFPRVEVVVSKKELAALKYRCATRTRDQNAIVEGLKRLSNHRHRDVYRGTNNRGDVIEITEDTQPIMVDTVTLTVTNANGEEVADETKVKLSFSFAFAYKITKEWSEVPSNINALISEFGQKTEVFWYLLATMLQEGGIKRNWYFRRIEKLEKDGKQPEANKELLNECEALLVSNPFFENKILENIKTKTYNVGTDKSGKAKINRTRLRKDIKDAMDALKKMGLILEWWEAKALRGKYTVKYNPSFASTNEQQKRLQDRAKTDEKNNAKK